DLLDLRGWYLRGFRPRALERRYLAEAATRRASTRIGMFLGVFVYFAVAPLYGPGLLQTPEALIPLYRQVEWFGLIPLALLGVLINWHRPHGRWTEWITLLVATGCVVCMLAMRLTGMAHGFIIPFGLLAMAQLVIGAMAGLSVAATLLFQFCAIAALLGTEWYWLGAGLPAFWWAVGTALLALSFSFAFELSAN